MTYNKNTWKAMIISVIIIISLAGFSFYLKTTNDQSKKDFIYSDSSINATIISTFKNTTVTTIKISLTGPLVIGDKYVLFVHPNDQLVSIQWGQNKDFGEMFIINTQLGPVSYKSWISSSDNNITGYVYSGSDLRTIVNSNGVSGGGTMMERGFSFTLIIDNGIQGTITYW